MFKIEVLGCTMRKIEVLGCTMFKIEVLGCTMCSHLAISQELNLYLLNFALEYNNFICWWMKRSETDLQKIRLTCVNNLIDYNWLNLSFTSFEIRCKEKLFT